MRLNCELTLNNDKSTGVGDVAQKIDNLTDPELIYKMGEAYFPTDLQKALKYYKKAAELNFLDGMLDAGIMYWKGWGTEKDYEKALQYLKRAADAGSAKATYIVGAILIYGQSNLYLGLEYFKRAAIMGYSVGEEVKRLLIEELYGIVEKKLWGDRGKGV